MALDPIKPVIVQVVDAATPETTVVDVLLGAIGLTGVLVGSAVTLGLLLGGVLIWLRIVRQRRLSAGAIGDRIGLGLGPDFGRT